MTTALRAWLEKATLATSDFTGGSNGGLLNAEQARAFLRIAIDQTAIISEARNETSASASFEVPRISMASRILRPGVEGSRLADADRVKPATGLVALATKLFKGEVPVTDEVFEDTVEGASVADTIATMVAEAVGRDAEELVIKSDTARDPAGADVADTASATFDQFDGLIKNMQGGLPAAQKLDATGVTEPEQMFAAMIAALPARYRRNYAGLRFYVPVVVADSYAESLSQRGTPVGDSALEGQRVLRYRGIAVKEVPLLSGTSTVNGAAIDYSKFAMLLDPNNVIVGWHRRIRIERFRDPREGVTSYLPSLRMDTKNADPAFGVLASNVALAV